MCLQRFGVLLCVTSLVGCASVATPGVAINTPVSLAGGGASSSMDASNARSAKTGGDAAAIVYLDGQPVWWSDLRLGMAEASGGVVLAELVLDRLIDQRLTEHGLTVGDEQITAESRVLSDSLDDADPDRAQRLLSELRQRQGLGVNRFKRLLARNAGLRLLVQDQVQVSDAALDQAYQLEYGPRYEARLIVTESLQEAGRLVHRASEGESFSDLAVQHSVDASRAQGGLISPVSPADPTYPKSIRTALAGLKPGQVADPIALERGFAVVRLERVITPKSPPPFDAVKPVLGRRVRRQVEQVYMQQLARTLMAEADVVVLDPVLNSSWDRHRKQLSPR